MDRPIPRSPNANSGWLETDFETEVRRAIDVGLDGFIWEYNTATPDVRFQRLPQLLAAARNVDPGFRIMLSPDFPTQAGASPDVVIKAIAQVQASPNLYRLDDGRLVIAPFYPERQPLSFWDSVLGNLAIQGVRTAYVPIFLSGGQGAMPSWASHVYGYSTWGARYASSARSYIDGASTAHSLGRIYMSPVSFEDVRPRTHEFTESSNSGELRESFMAAIDGAADWIYLATWNDYTESWMSPSRNRGYAVADVSAYYVDWFKSGTAPKISQDVLYYFHRRQRTDARILGLPSLPNAKIHAGDPPANQVELLAFLKAPGQLTIRQGGVRVTMDAPGGVTSFKTPLIQGTTPIFTLERSKKPVIQVTSNTSIVSRITLPDLSYHAGSSIPCQRP